MAWFRCGSEITKNPTLYLYRTNSLSRDGSGINSLAEIEKGKYLVTTSASCSSGSTVPTLSTRLTVVSGSATIEEMYSNSVRGSGTESEYVVSSSTVKQYIVDVEEENTQLMDSAYVDSYSTKHGLTITTTMFKLD